VDASECVIVPDSVSNEQASWTSLACTSQLAVRRAQVQLGESAAVVGLGVLGQLVVQYLRLCGARRIIAIDPTDSRLVLAQAGGATDLVAEGVLTAIEALKDITRGAMVDVAFDITGHPKVLAPTTQLVRPLGRVVLLGDTPMPSNQTLGPRVVADSVSILGVHASSAPETVSASDPWTLQAMTELYFDFVSTSRLNVDSLITHRFTPDESVDVYEALRIDRSSFLGVLLDWTTVEL
jgi:threonine dehydrogenase-like Zn-dependent dehydrogenase